jgi:hypothetical protein
MAGHLLGKNKSWAFTFNNVNWLIGQMVKYAYINSIRGRLEGNDI